MKSIYKRYFFLVTNTRISIGLLLRRTLVLKNMFELCRSVDLKQYNKFVFSFVQICATCLLVGKVRGKQKMHSMCIPILLFLFGCFFNNLHAQRQDILLNNGWQTIANDSNQHAYNGFESSSYKTTAWKTVNVPHNWDAYDGYRRLVHGNKHGYAWYKKSFTISKRGGKRYFLYFEGVGSYATVWLNGKQVGSHAGGRTTFTIDVTDEIISGKQNHLAVRADHPSNIKNLPWVCGGCSDERGFSEGSQPMGVFRPVHLIVTDEIRIEPFGVHVWNDTSTSEKSAIIYIETTIRNYSAKDQQIVFQTSINSKGYGIGSKQTRDVLKAYSSVTVKHKIAVADIDLWSLKNPYLYEVHTDLMALNGSSSDRLVTPYGIRTIKWDKGNSNRFFLNGKPIFINGIAEYEHLLGSSHAFTNEQIASRAKMVKQLGFNAFRDAHQPHNLLYQHYWDSLGILSWTQHSAHVWYDTKEFRDNFKTLLKEWVIERRNSPSIILWGLQNESKLPKDFAEECTALIRSLDPTASSQRLVTTCNGGEGTDWDVPQNWTGTYGGNPYKYDEDVKRQVLIGEYGAWRTLDLHSEGNFKQNGALSEDRFTQLMETKIRLAEQVKDSAAGHFHWLLTSHDNPGRVQGGEGLRELDRIGPVNYKGLLTPWEEPTDAYYMYKSNYASNKTDAMVYIVSHTWPSRWKTIGKKDSIIVYSNCDEVELFNDVNNLSLGKKKKGAIGTHFQWDGVDINYNVLYAVGYVNGKAVVKDHIVLNHLPQAPHFGGLSKNSKNIAQAQLNYTYLYRINCGGRYYQDLNGQLWQSDKSLGNQISNQFGGSSSWTDDFPDMPSFFASQRKTSSPISGTAEWKLFQNFRYGRDKLKYVFPLPDGEYLVELYFIEPWLGVGSRSNCRGMRLFDVAINDKIVLHNLDIWSEIGTNAVLKKTIKAKITGGKLMISFPNVAAGQALISAIAIASNSYKDRLPDPFESNIISDVKPSKECQIVSWIDNGMQQFVDDYVSFFSLPSNLYEAEYLALRKNHYGHLSFAVNENADVFVAIPSRAVKPDWLNGFDDTKTIVENDDSVFSTFSVFRRRFAKGSIINLSSQTNKLSFSVFVLPVTNMQPAYDLKPISSYRPLQATVSTDAEHTTVNTRDAITFKSNIASLEWNVSTGVADVYSITIRYANETAKDLKAILQLLQADGTLMKEDTLNFTASKTGKWNYTATNTGSMINAGNYIIKIKAVDAIGLSISALDIQ
jgi:beta-galactosidase